MKLGVGFKLPAVEWLAVPLVVAFAAVLAISVFVAGFDQLEANLRKIDAATLGFCLLAMLWQSGSRCLRWFIYVRGLGLGIRLREAFLYYAAAFGMTLTPARLGELLRLWFLEKRFGVYYRRIAGLYVADRVSDVTAYLLLLAAGSAAYLQGPVSTWVFRLAVVAAIVLMMKPRPVIAALTAAYAAMRRGRRLTARIRRIVRNTAILFQPGVFLPGVAVGTAGWLAAPMVLAMSLAQMGAEIDPLHAAAIYAAAALAGGATMMPGGGGATEAALVVLLTATNVPLDVAVAAMLVTRLTFLWLPVGVGIVLLPIAIRAARAAEKARI